MWPIPKAGPCTSTFPLHLEAGRDVGAAEERVLIQGHRDHHRRQFLRGKTGGDTGRGQSSEARPPRPDPRSSPRRSGFLSRRGHRCRPRPRCRPRRFGHRGRGSVSAKAPAHPVAGPACAHFSGPGADLLLPSRTTRTYSKPHEPVHLRQSRPFYRVRHSRNDPSGQHPRRGQPVAGVSGFPRPRGSSRRRRPGPSPPISTSTRSPGALPIFARPSPPSSSARMACPSMRTRK